jgi:hypothetical protein
LELDINAYSYAIFYTWQIQKCSSDFSINLKVLKNFSNLSRNEIKIPAASLEKVGVKYKINAILYTLKNICVVPAYAQGLSEFLVVAVFEIDLEIVMLHKIRIRIFFNTISTNP